MKEWRVDKDLYARYVKLKKLVLYANIASDFIPFFITQLFHKFDNHTIHSLWLFWIMPPKSDKNKSNPEKHAELSEN